MYLFCEAGDKIRLINALISFGICSTPKLSNKKHYYFAHTKQINEFQYQNTHQIYYISPILYFG